MSSYAKIASWELFLCVWTRGGDKLSERFPCMCKVETSSHDKLKELYNGVQFGRVFTAFFLMTDIYFKHVFSQP